MTLYIYRQHWNITIRQDIKGIDGAINACLLIFFYKGTLTT